MKKFTCPYCYGTHTLETCGVKCSYSIPGRSDSCIRDVQKSIDGWIPQGNVKECMKCTDAAQSVYCTVANKVIPKKILSDESLSIALLGARASGKSNYIGALVKEISAIMSRSFNCSIDLVACEESWKCYNQNYQIPLEKGIVVGATDTTEYLPPLIFPLTFSNKKDKIIKRTSLTFYDTAGENLDSAEDMLINNRYIPNASGIIFLMDPLQIPSIREKLEGKMPLPSVNTSSQVLLSRIVNNIRNVKKIKSKKKIKKPIAIVFTKIDALAKFDVLKTNSVLKQESDHVSTGKFVVEDFESVNIEIRDLIENWYQTEIVQYLSEFEEYAFFGVSALGGVPNGTKLQNNQVNSLRVLDPLLWLLAKKKCIKTKR